MKKFMLCVLRGLMTFIYAVMKLLSAKRDRVLFISRESDSASENFLLIAEEIRKRSPNTDLRFSCKNEKGDKLGLRRPFLVLERMRLLAGARVCITESESIELGILKHRPEMRIIQIWHSIAPFRKFGWQITDTELGLPADVAEGVRYHSGYDYIIVGSEFAREVFSQAMRTDKSRILPLGLPVTDSMIRSDGESERFKLWKLHPSTCGKMVVVYAPTIRPGAVVPCEELAAAFDYENYSLVVRLHPKDTETIFGDERAVVDTEMSTQEAIRAADIIITDYSGVAAEASLLGKPVFFYTPDIDEYCGDFGLNTDPSELFPQLTFSDASELMKAIKSCEKDNAEQIRSLLAGACKGDSAKSIASLALETSLGSAAPVKAPKKGSKFGDFLARCSYTFKYLGSNIDPMLILFESKTTHHYSGSVKELYEEISADKKYEDCRFAWAVADENDVEIPGGMSVLVVKYGSSEHMQVHARAGMIVSDEPLSNRVRLRSEQHYFVADGNTKESIRRIIG